MAGHLLAVYWPDKAQVRKWVKAPFLPNLLGADSVTIGKKTRSVKTILESSDGHIRHEFQHGRQQQGKFVPWWIIRYINPFSKKFKNAMENDAKDVETEIFPSWRVVGTIN